MRSLTLRAKALVTGCLVALVVSLLASSATFGVARLYLLNQRESVALTQALAAGRQVARGLADGQAPLDALLVGSRVLPSARALLKVGDDWLVTGVGVTASDLPAPLLESVSEGVPTRQRASAGSSTYVFTAMPIDTAGVGTATFVAASSLDELGSSLFTLRLSLLLGVALATGAGGLVALWLSRRVQEPLHAVSEAASAISSGKFDTRVDEPQEPDLAAIARAFNVMAESMETRIQRDAQFAAHVSHELRSPLTVIRSATDLLARRRDELGERERQGIDLLRDRVDAFEKILADLLEISRYESNLVTSNPEAMDLRRLVTALLERAELDPSLFDPGDTPIDSMVSVDVRRFTYCFRNIAENARLYGGGLVAVRAEHNDDTVSVHLDDAGPGVADGERQMIFQPFTRGTRHSGVQGSGLGLAIVHEHMRVMGGAVAVDTSPEGGARFTLVMARVTDE